MRYLKRNIYFLKQHLSHQLPSAELESHLYLQRPELFTFRAATNRDIAIFLCLNYLGEPLSFVFYFLWFSFGILAVRRACL